MGLFLAILSVQSGCNTQFGVAPGVLSDTASSNFSGITGANILSPTSVQVNWSASSSYSNYQVFAAGISQPLATSLFSSATLTGLTPNSSYTLSVGGYPTGGGPIFGTDSTVALQTWPAFTGATQVTALPNASTINVVWSFPDAGPSFSIYVNQGSPPTDFTTPELTSKALSAMVTTWGGGKPIQPSTTYYIIVRASYLDGTTDTNLNALPATTPSAINPLPTVSTAPVILGLTPSFTISNGLNTYKTTFALGSTVLGVFTGNGTFIPPSNKPLSPGVNTVTVTVQSGAYTATLPPITIVSRSLSGKLNDAPELWGGKGMQAFGSVMAVGDFNCDGYDDLAIAAPYGTYFNAPYVFGAGNYPANGLQQGGVYVFYGGGPTGVILPGQYYNGKLVPNPSTNPTGLNPLFIPYPNNIYQSGGQVNGTTQGWLGYSLTAGNINGDTNTVNSNTYSCDDLAIGAPSFANTYFPGTYATSVGGVLVYYGSSSGIQLGPLVVNSPACVGGVCSPQMITPVQTGTESWTPLAGYSVPYFGAATAMGHFFSPSTPSVPGPNFYIHDLAVSAPNYEGDASVTNSAYGRVFIYPGSTSGIVLNPANNGYAAAYMNAPYTATPPYAVAPAAQISSESMIIGTFGVALAAMDIDADGYTDLFVGSPFDSDTSNTVRQGSVWYYHNPGSGGFQNSVSPTLRLQSGLSTYPFDYGNTYWGGYLASAGDINGDGFPDLVVGVGVGGFNGQWILGPEGMVVSAIYGSASGPQGFTPASPPLASLPTAAAINTTSCTSGTCNVQHFTWNNSSGAATFLGNWGTYWTSRGTNLAGAKTDNNLGQGFLKFGGQRLNVEDNYADVLLGTPTLGTSASGQGAILYGSAAGLKTVPSIVSPYQARPFDSVGQGVAIGFFQAPSLACAEGASSSPTSSIALGAPMTSGSDIGSRSGVVYAFMPGSTCDFGASVTIPTPTTGTGSQGIRVNLAAEVADNYGNGQNGQSMLAHALGDVNNDGYTDLSVSVQVGNIPGNYTSSFGLNMANQITGNSNYNNIWVHIVYYGSANGIDLTATPSVNPVGLEPLLLVPPTTSGCGASNQLPCSTVYSDYYAPYSVGNSLVPAGDVNGDGFADAMIIGGPYGMVLYFGSASGLQYVAPPATDNTNLDPRLYQIISFFSPYPDQNYTFGDFNGDGFSDIAIGWTNASVQPNYGAEIAAGGSFGYSQGAVTVYYGSPTGLQAVPGQPVYCSGTFNSGGVKTFPGGQTTNLCDTNSNVSLSQPCDGTGGVNTAANCVLQQLIPPPLENYETNYYPIGFGTSVATAGDVNHDGFDDLLVGAAQDGSLSGGLASGVVYLYYGGPYGLNVSSSGYGVVQTQSSPQVYSPLVISPPGGPAVGTAPQACRYFGYYYFGGVGDVNKDGYGDFVIGSPFEGWQTGGANSYGGAYLFYGCQAGVGNCPNTGIYGITYSPATGFKMVNDGGISAGCTAGSACVVVNAPSCSSAGCSPLFFQPPHYLAGYGGQSYWGMESGGVGDINGDGYADVIIAPGIAGGSGPVALSGAGYQLANWSLGMAIVYTGSPTGLVVTGTPSTSPQCASGAGCSPFVLVPPYSGWGEAGHTEWYNLAARQAFIGFATSKKIVDFNGDGNADFFLNYQTFWNASQTAFGTGGMIFFQ